MSRRRIKIVQRGTTFVIRGWRGGDLAREAGVRAVFNGVAQGWVGDSKHLPDLIAFLEYRNVAVDLVGGGGDD